MREFATDGSGVDETLAEVRGRGVEEPPLERGETVGRYLILEEVGAGGMGVVYAAYDPELDRKVALKRLHADRSGLLHEAQAMARLSHPNVVTVHDVGVHEGRVFLAMEYVQGQTLAAFSKGDPRRWSEVLEIFCAAGRGLAAAHKAGLVHRDFKPDNVLLRAGGVVKVTDFGLALAAPGSASEHDHPSPRDHEGSGPVDLPRSTGGGIVGTPAYMAPEQHLGLPTDPRSDQFSFCVALYEALYRRRPFEARSRAELAIIVIEGQVSDPPAGSRVPSWLRQAVLRGLQARPEARYASMSELLEALAPEPRNRSRQWIGAAIVSTLGLAAIGLGFASLQRDDPPELCADMEQHLTGIWDDESRARVQRGLRDSGVGFADSSFARVAPGLDAYARDWVAQRESACGATQIRKEQSQALMDLRMACLDQRLDDLRSVVEVLSQADAIAAQHAVNAVASLPELSVCADKKTLLASVPPPDPATSERVDDIRSSLAQVRAQSSAGQYEPALALARSSVDQARATDYAPVLVEALYRRGELEHETGAEAEAEATLQASYSLAVEHHLDESAARSAAQLVTLVGKKRVRPVEGRLWSLHARAHAEAADHELLRAAALHALAGVAYSEGAFDEARSRALEAREIRTNELGPTHVSHLASLNLLGVIALDTGENEQADAYFDEGLELGRQILGPDHPDLGRVLNNMAKSSWIQGQLDEAEELFRHALDLQVTAFGPDHRNVAQLHNNLAAVAASKGDMEEAGRRFTLALKIWSTALGPDHPSVADGLNNLGAVSSALGRYEEARDYDQRALDIRLRTMESDHPSLAQSYHNLGEDLRHLGELERALTLHRQAVELWETKLGPSHDDVALGLTSIATDLLLLQRSAEALPLLERALEIRAGLEIDEVERAHTKWALARALWAVPSAEGRDRRRARELAREALRTYETSQDPELAAVAAWLEQTA